MNNKSLLLPFISVSSESTRNCDANTLKRSSIHRIVYVVAVFHWLLECADLVMSFLHFFVCTSFSLIWAKLVNPYCYKA